MGTKKNAGRLRRKRSIRGKVFGTEAQPRLSVFRSNKATYAQLIDDNNGKTLVAVSSSGKEMASAKGTKVELAKEVGKKVAELASKAGVESVVFDRNGYLYHGRVKAVAEGAREGGLKL